jgi:hypothetical protein
MRPCRIDLHIEELVLHGLAPADRYRIGEAAERELGRLFSEQGLPSSLLGESTQGRLDGGSFEITQDASPDAIGVQVARAVYGVLGNG